MRKSIFIGSTNKSFSEIRDIINDLRNNFDPESYHPITKNCNFFANELSKILLNKEIPLYVNRLAYLSSFMSCILPGSLGLEPKGEKIVIKPILSTIESMMYDDTISDYEIVDIEANYNKNKKN